MVGIKDFDMPRCCNSCSHWSFNRDDEPLCDLTYEYIKQFDKRQEDCPLVEVKCNFCGISIKRVDYLNSHKSKDADCLKKLIKILVITKFLLIFAK